MLRVKFADCTFRSRNQDDGDHSTQLTFGHLSLFAGDLHLRYGRHLAQAGASDVSIIVFPPPLVRIVIVTEWMFYLPCDPDFGSFMPRFHELQIHGPVVTVELIRRSIHQRNVRSRPG